MSFALRQKVEWESQARSYAKKKAGVVLAVVPGWPPLNCSQFRLSEFIPVAYAHYRHMFDGWQRKHECYIVLVEGSRGGKKIYCPVVSKLKAVMR